MMFTVFLAILDFGEASIILSSNNVRLRGGSRTSEGRVEVYHDGVWGTICDDSWSNNDATVVCKMLGFPGAISAREGAYYGQGTGKIWLDNVACQGNERTLNECSHNGWGSNDCTHREDASVQCSSTPSTARPDFNEVWIVILVLMGLSLVGTLLAAIYRKTAAGVRRQGQQLARSQQNQPQQRERRGNVARHRASQSIQTSARETRLQNHSREDNVMSLREQIEPSPNAARTRRQNQPTGRNTVSAHQLNENAEMASTSYSHLMYNTQQNEDYVIMREDDWKKLVTEKVTEDGGEVQGATCVVCCSEKADNVFLPCFHMCCCDSCARGVKSTKPVCPMCRRQFNQYRKVYF